MADVCVVFAHPYPQRSRANRSLLRALKGIDNVHIRSLYALYPDFGIDADAEQAALVACDVMVWQCPFYWYGMPALLTHWIEKVLARGFAYDGGRALAGKRALWVTTTGAPESAYRPGALHGHPFQAFVPHVEQIARFCGMEWEPPLVVHGAHRITDEELAAFGVTYRARITQLAQGKVTP